MSITSRSVPFTESLVAAAPHAPGVFALWQGGGIVYYGRAATIRIALDEQLRARAISGERDRKSTRLNSSHTVISYAVFCLKKKKTTRGATSSVRYPRASANGSALRRSRSNNNRPSCSRRAPRTRSQPDLPVG